MQSDSIEGFLSSPPYGLEQKEKENVLLPLLEKMTQQHGVACSEYGKILEAMDSNTSSSYRSLTDIPFIPVRLFKEYKLSSISDGEIIKTLTSSGTTSQKVSKIFLDRITARFQTKALVTIMKNYLGSKRLPMLIVDHPNVVKDRTSFSARGAGILGLMNFGRDTTYLLNESMEIDFVALNDFLKKYHNEPIFIFGFTFMVWQYLFKPLQEEGLTIDIPQGILVHSGGWKKLQDEAVDNETFKRSINNRTGIKSIHNFYGMVEQVGSIYMECKEGHLHAPVFSDVIIRDPYDWSVVPNGKIGVIQVLSILPHSYPGHSLLTEDLGSIIGVDNCACGRKGKYFSVFGRIPRAEVRGCSDTHASEVS